MRSIIELVASAAWTKWLATAASPPEPSTAEKASRTGTPAATKAPNATSSTRKVIGSDSRSAFEIPSLIVRLSWRLELASPNSATMKPGAALWSSATALSTGCTRSDAVSGLPLMSNSTRAEWPSLEIWPRSLGVSGERRLWTWLRFFSLATTLRTSWRKAESEAVCVPL